MLNHTVTAEEAGISNEVAEASWIRNQMSVYKRTAAEIADELGVTEETIEYIILKH